MSMIILVKRPYSEILQLDAYTYSEREWAALKSVIERVGSTTAYTSLGFDKNDRPGRRYALESSSTISALQELLRGNFDVNGRFEPDPPRDASRKYACREVTRSGMGKGCEEFAAPDDATAIVICGILAGRRSWLGGDAKSGGCGSKRGLKLLWR